MQGTAGVIAVSLGGFKGKKISGCRYNFSYTYIWEKVVENTAMPARDM